MQDPESVALLMLLNRGWPAMWSDGQWMVQPPDSDDWCTIELRHHLAHWSDSSMPDQIKRADAIEVGHCGNCGAIHIVFFDDSDQAFAEGVVPPQILPELIEDLKKAAYAAAVEMDDPPTQN